MDELQTAERAEQPKAAPSPGALARMLRHPAVPGLLAAALFLTLAAGAGSLGRAAGPLALVLSVALAGTLLARPRSIEALRRLVAWPGLWHALAVAAVVALGGAMRFWGINFGLPYLDHPDEWAVADRAVQMLRTGDYSPHSFIYPTLYTYLQMGVAAVHFLWGAGAGIYRTLDDIDPARYYLWGRAVTAALGTGAVLLTYVLGRMLYSRTAGLLAAAFLAVYPAAAGDAHYITTDTPSQLFTLLAFVPIVLLSLAEASGSQRLTSDDRRSATDERRSRRPVVRGPSSFAALALLSGLGVGLATATKYNVAVLVVPLTLALLYGAKQAAGGVSWPSVVGRWAIGGLWALLGIVVGFTLGTPAWLPELPLMLNDLASVLEHYKFRGHAGAETDNPTLFYWESLLANGALLAWAFLGGILLAFARRRRADLLVLSFVVPYVLQMTSVRVVFFRNAMPLMPFLCILAGAAVVWLVALVADHRRPTTGDGRRGALGRRWPAVGLALALVLLTAQPLAQIARDNWLRALPTTRIVAAEWVEQNAPDGARIWLESQTIALSDRLRIEGGKPVERQPPEWYAQNGFRFLVVNVYGRRDDLDRLATFGDPVARFAPEARLGPTLAVYDTGYGDPSRDERTASGATLGGGAITLDGYRHAADARPGDTLRLALYWRANREVPGDYTVFVHLIDERGDKAAQRDLAPLDGRRPTGGWKPGELLRDDQDLPLPATLPPGTYRLVVGMYDPATLTAINDGGPIDIGTVVVRPS